ncbi:hypothetical protein TNIN_175651, partial [Trichonephila inaurata madagascariensis]
HWLRRRKPFQQPDSLLHFFPKTPPFHFEENVTNFWVLTLIPAFGGSSTPDRRRHLQDDGRSHDGHMMGGWHDGGGGGKGVTFGLKSNGMTAIIPIPLPVPVFTKDKGGGGGGGKKVKYIPVPVPSGGGKEDWWR